MNFIHTNLSITRRQIFILLRGLYVLLKFFMYTSLPLFFFNYRENKKNKIKKYLNVLVANNMSLRVLNLLLIN